MDCFRGIDIPPPDGGNKWIEETFPDGKYKDIEGLCKIVDIEEIVEQDFSLTPGRYVGVSIHVDMDFDFKGRISEIHTELDELNEEANQLMNQIQSLDL
jgi:type I restriction enzyme M protein